MIYRESTTDGYEMVQTKPSEMIARLDRDLSISELQAKTSMMTVNAHYQFQPSPSGLLLKSLTAHVTMEPSSVLPETTFEFAYGSLGGMELPQSLTVHVQTSKEMVMKLDFTGCKLTQ